MAFEHVVVEQRGPAAWIIINRPPYNILNLKAITEIQEALHGAWDDPKARVIVLAAKGEKAFSAGVDFKDYAGEKAQEAIHVLDSLAIDLLTGTKPTIAAVRGMALGGACELVACCDFAVAAENAQFGQPEIKAGVFPPVAALVFARFFGWKPALRLLLTGDTISASQALELGLVNKVVPQVELERETEALVLNLASKNSAVISVAKRAALIPLGNLKEQIAEIEDCYHRELMSTRDANEGLTAFLEKRNQQVRNQG